ncbi:MAG: carboxypeptidase-like regulatory domain-containing protein [Planctomycetota bacterium]
MWLRGIAGLALAAALTGTLGCSSDGYTSAEVTGTVTHQGKPAANLWVQFSHAEPQGSGPARLPPALGGTDSEGRYRLMRPRSKPGAPVGRYRVTFSIQDGAASAVPGDAVMKQSFDVEVGPGANVLDFAL